jgi:hypothetical protein
LGAFLKKKKEAFIGSLGQRLICLMIEPALFATKCCVTTHAYNCGECGHATNHMKFGVSMMILVLCMLILGECGDGGGMVISCGIFRAILVSNKTLEYDFQTIFKFTTKH